MNPQPEISLSTGIFQSNNELPEGTAYPEAIVQVLNIKKVPNGQGQPGMERYRLMISDGVNYIQSMIASQLNELVSSGSITKFGIIKLQKYICNTVSSKRILIILALENLTPFNDTIQRVGNPVSLDGNTVTDPNAATHAPAVGSASTFGQQHAPALPTSSFSRQQGQQPMALPSSYNQQAGRSALSGSGSSNMPYGGGASTVNNGDTAGPYFAIKTLNPYQNKWTIKGVIINKGSVRTWNKAGREGRLFNFTISDDSGDIRCTGFNEAVDMFYESIQEGQAYVISKAMIKVSNPAFNKGGHDYEMTIDPHTSITVCNDPKSIPQIKYNALTLDRLLEVEKDAVIDVLAVVKECFPVSEITTKANNKLKKRDLNIVDESGWLVRLTLWGSQAETFEHSDNPVIGIKNARVGDFGGRTLSVAMSSTLTLNPTMQDAFRLRGWFDAKASSIDFHTYSKSSSGVTSGNSTHSNLKTIQQIQDANLGNGEKPDYVSLRAFISFAKRENLWYPACPNEACRNKKVVEIGSEWRCEKCDSNYPHPVYRYITSFSVSDYTGQTWLQAFNETVEKVLGKTANEMQKLVDTDKDEFDRIIEQAIYQEYVFDVRAKAEMYQDAKKTRLTIVEAKEVDYAAASREMLATISSVLG
ncbi:Replication factor A protein 1 [Batrachochytrium dendrobatidis]